ncbi:hypothetical protein ACFLZB_03660 [Nanoarchaeota archaeon]
MSYQAEAQEIMYRANQAMVATPVRYMEENKKVLSGINYKGDDYLSRVHDLFKGSGDLLRESYKQPGSSGEDPVKKAANPTSLTNLINSRYRKIA